MIEFVRIEDEIRYINFDGQLNFTKGLSIKQDIE